MSHSSNHIKLYEQLFFNNLVCYRQVNANFPVEKVTYKKTYKPKIKDWYSNSFVPRRSGLKKGKCRKLLPLPLLLINYFYLKI